MIMEFEDTGDSEIIPKMDGSFLDVSLVEEVPGDNRELHECAICGKTYKLKASLTRHLKKHSDSHQHSCTKCTMYFTSEQALRTHCQRKHINIHLCTVCGASFATKGSLDRHLLRKHPDADGVDPSKRMTCPFPNCLKVFIFKRNFQDHMNVHTDMKPYSCISCTKAFHSLYHKTEHEKVCSGLAEYRCEECNKSFADNSSLNRHVGTQHRGKRYQCICGKDFAYHSSLLKHKKQQHH